MPDYRSSTLWALLIIIISGNVSSTAINGVGTTSPTLSGSYAVLNSAPSIGTITSATETVATTTPITLPISSYPFSSFPVPSASSIPGVFPSTSPNSPPSPGSRLIPDFGPAWAEARAKAKALVSRWTLEQKVSACTGIGFVGSRCAGNIAASDVGDHWPGLCLQGGPLGVRSTDFVTAFPAGMNAATTWNRSMIRARGKAIGQEFKGKGVNIGLGPMMNIARIPQAGRNWEGFGADPFLSGEAAYETVLGWQEGGAQACAKHYINKHVSSSFTISPFEVSFTVSNTGKVKGGEIPQLYLHFPPGAREPPSVLRGFSDVLLEPGESKITKITLSRYDLSVWDSSAQGWRKPEGTFSFSVGASSRDFRLHGTIPV